MLWCEHSRLPLHVLNGASGPSGLYETSLRADWVRKTRPWLRAAAVVAGMIVPLAGAAIGAAMPAASDLSDVSSRLDSFINETADTAVDNPLIRDASVLRDLHKFVRSVDPSFAGLVRVLAGDGFRWVHPQFVSEYSPLVSDILASARRMYISYRRGDTDALAETIYGALVTDLGPSNVVMDTVLRPSSTSDLGSVTVATCDVMLVLIGRNWLGQLENPTDAVRQEIETALRLDRFVVPVFVDGARAPAESELPPSIAPLARRHGVALSLTDPESSILAVLRGTRAFSSRAGVETATPDDLRPGAAASGSVQPGEASRALEVPANARLRFEAEPDDLVRQLDLARALAEADVAPKEVRAGSYFESENAQARQLASGPDARLVSGRVSYELDRERSVALVRTHGVLETNTMAELRGVLLDCLADQPTGIIVDAVQLSIADDLGLTMLAGVARESQRWPGTRFVLAGEAELLAAAQRLGVDQYVTLRPDRTAAIAVFDGAVAPPTRRYRMNHDSSASSLARVAVREFCETHAVGGDGSAAVLVASELVTNAVMHAQTDIELTLRLIPPLLHIAVRDYGPGQARVDNVVDETSPTGRGLLLVDALSAAWGSLVADNGKVVWATIRVRTTKTTGNPTFEPGKGDI